MALPIAQIISAAAPLVMNAVELYRRRHDAAAGETGGSAGGLEHRMRALEEADLEQSRLIAELSRSLEALARNHEATIAELRRKEATLRGLLWAVVTLGVTTLALSIWALTKV